MYVSRFFFCLNFARINFMGNATSYTYRQNPKQKQKILKKKLQFDMSFDILPSYISHPPLQFFLLLFNQILFSFVLRPIVILRCCFMTLNVFYMRIVSIVCNEIKAKNATNFYEWMWRKEKYDEMLRHGNMEWSNFFMVKFWQSNRVTVTYIFFFISSLYLSEAWAWPNIILHANANHTTCKNGFRFILYFYSLFSLPPPPIDSRCGFILIVKCVHRR